MSTGNAVAALAGADALIRNLKLADPKIRARTITAIQKNAKAIAAQAKARAPKVTGEMASTIRDEYSSDKLTGYVKVGLGTLPRRSKAMSTKGKAKARGRTRTVGPGAYAPVVERGDPRRHHKPHPFLIPSFTQQKPTAVEDITKALNDTVDEI